MSSSFSTQSEPASCYYGLSAQYQEQYEYLRSMNYNLEVQRPKLMPTDWLNFHIDVLSHSVDSNSVTCLNTLLNNYQEVSSKRFFREGKDWFRSILFHQDFPSDSLEQLALKLVSEVHELFNFDERLFGSDLAIGVGPSDARRFTLHLRIVVEI
ncbi:hypothetical protein MtrunA17_Chr8g0368771 [Medicago truncatula]|uniref:Uncharacterized protein n=1 Tax=Medicago truncatula TaxID=3880 RepID=A0A072TS40_MEDTR|nr:uncharacterized protein LOC25501510 [Medicago truncatula]KEH20232.1 hypothetical protein MTR_8g069985 [Medicago truncatula]RHN41693.1 hypothetical protein MtrunA17_Chr8g0368771 [Medicago truncatula]